MSHLKHYSFYMDLNIFRAQWCQSGEGSSYFHSPYPAPCTTPNFPLTALSSLSILPKVPLCDVNKDLYFVRCYIGILCLEFAAVVLRDSLPFTDERKC